VQPGHQAGSTPNHAVGAQSPAPRPVPWTHHRSRRHTRRTPAAAQILPEDAVFRPLVPYTRQRPCATGRHIFSTSSSAPRSPL
jgi:hypothetical protein